MNEFLQPDQKNSKIHMEQNLDLTKSSFLVPRYNEDNS